MNKFKKISLAFLICLLIMSALYTAGIFYIQNCIDLNKYKDNLFNEIKTQTGFSIQTENIYTEKSFSPDLKVHLYHTLVLYPDDNQFLKLKDIDLTVKLIPLLFKQIVISEAKFTRPIINITIYKDFSTSLSKYLQAPKKIKSSGYNFDSTILNTICNQYRLKIFDETLNKTFFLEGDELLLKNFNPKNNVHFILKGILKEQDHEYLNYDLDITSSLNLNYTKLSFSPFKPIWESDIKGSISGKLKINNSNHIFGNLKINDVSLKTGNIRLNNNNINLDFEGEQVKFDAQLHTSKQDKALFKGNFAYGKKKNIYINTNAKNINLENLYTVISVIAKSLNIKNFIKDIKIKGLLNADFIINSDLKKLKSNGTILINNASVFHNKLPYSITNINANISLDNNNIQINKADADINKTPLHIKGNIKEDVSFDLSVSSDNLNLVSLINLFELKDKLNVNLNKGQISFNSQISGILNKTYKTNNIIKLKGLKFNLKETNIPISIDESSITAQTDEKNIKTDILCTNLELIAEQEKILLPEFKLKTENKKIIIPENTTSHPFKVTFSGSVNNEEKNKSALIDIKGNIDAQKLALVLNKKIKLPYKAQGLINTKGKIIANEKSNNINLKFYADKNNYISYLVINELLNKPSIINIDMDINKDNLNIKELSLSQNDKEQTKIIKASGNIKDIKKPVFKDFRISIMPQITFASSFIGGEQASLNADLTLNNTIDKPQITGNIKLLKYNLKKYLTSIKNADINFTKDNIRITAPDVAINDSNINLLLDIIPDFKNIIITNLQLNALNLDLNSLFPIINNEKNPFKQSKISIKKGTALINNFRILDLKAKDVISDITAENNIIKINNINAKAYNGEIKGKSEYDLGSGHLYLNLEGKSLNIKDSLYDLCKLSDNLEGYTDIKTDISLYSGANYNNVIKSINGKLIFNAHNGKMGSLGKFEHYLYAKNLMYHGFLNATLNRIATSLMRDNTAEYKNASGNLLFQNGFIITDNLKTTGTNMSILVKGKHNLLTNESNITVNGRISDEIKNKLGSFGDVSISEIINNKKTDKYTTVLKVDEEIINQIPSLYRQNSAKTNTFTVNIFGNINSFNSINSFMWTIPKTKIQEEANEVQDETLPDFKDMTQDL